MPTISLCMIVKNEELHLQKCLESVKGLVDEIVIVDTGSIERTKEIAKKSGAKVVEFEWSDDFAAARNVSLQHATGDWILVLDADETLSKKDHEKIKQYVRENADAYFLIQRDYLPTCQAREFTSKEGDTYDESKPYPGWHENKLIRLFKKSSIIQFSGVVHESVLPALRKDKLTIKETNIPIHHYGRLKDNLERKEELYFALGEKKLAQNPSDAKACFEHAKRLSNGKYKDLARAEKLMEKAYGIDPTLHVLPHLLQIYRERGEWEKLEQLYKQTPQPDQDSHICYALHCMDRSKFTTAKEILTPLLQNKKVHPLVYLALAQCEFTEQNNKQARVWIKKVHAIDQNNIDAFDLLLKIELREGNLIETKKILDSLFAKFPFQHEFHLAMALYYEKMNAPKEAREYYTNAKNYGSQQRRLIEKRIEQITQFLQEQALQ